MQYGELAGNRSINAMIYQCFELLEERDIRAFVRKFRAQEADEQLVMHTFRELLAGTFVAGQGWRPEYEPEIDKQTPDWRFINSESTITFILDVVNFHAAKNTEDEQKAVLAEGHIWTGWLSANTTRLYSSLLNKAGQYKRLVEKHHYPYIIGVYPFFSACFSAEELTESVDPPDGIFPHYPEVSGALVFEEGGLFFSENKPLAYRFTYLPNPSAVYPVSIRAGSLPIPLI